MSPLLKHASGKLKGSSEKRRVIQIVYGPAALPEPFRWYGYDVQQGFPAGF
jgi:hypothetical protein